MIIPGQYRLSQLQVHNWGTFSGLHTVDVARKGFLITGPSGSGKSTLIDALSTILVPPTKRRFNAAAGVGAGARSGGRNLITYARGAWRREHSEEVDELTRSYLRTGATWTGVGLRYSDGAGTTITAVRLMYLNANAHSATDIVDLYLLFKREAELQEFEQLAREGLDIRVARKQFPDAVAVQRNHPPFITALRRHLGIADPGALELLHTTQSAKTLGDLNHLMRFFMLPEPSTFTKAQTAVDNFTELQVAYQSVETAREQIEQLTPIRVADELLTEIDAELASVKGQIAGLERFTLQQRLDFAVNTRDTAASQAAAAADELDANAGQLRRLREDEKAIETQIHGAEGTGIVQARNRRDNAAQELTRVQAARATFETQAGVLEATMPSGTEEFTNLRLQLQDLIEEQDANAQRYPAQREETYGRLTRARQDRDSDGQRLEAIRQYRSSMDRDLLRARELIAGVAGVQPDQLPFIADLIHVSEGEEKWQPVAERVIGGFARRLIVAEEFYPQVSAAANAHHLNAKVEYVRFGREQAETVPQRFVPGSLATRIAVRPSRYHRWLQAQLSKDFDYACVDTVEEFQAERRAVTRQGQVKRTRHHHIKDDRSAITDRGRWVLSGNTDDKIEHLQRVLREHEQEVAKTEREKTGLEKRIKAEELVHATAAGLLGTTDYAAIDVVSAASNLEDAQRMLDELSDSNTELTELRKRLRALEPLRREAEQKQDELNKKLGGFQNQRDVAQTDVDELGAQLEGAELLAETVATALEERFTRHDRSIRADNVNTLSQKVSSDLAAESTTLTRRATQQENRTTTAMRDYLNRWPSRTGDLSPELAYRREFITELDRLERDDLPRFADKFRDMQQTQTHQYLGEILRQVRQAAREIRNSVESINQSLRAVEFYPGTYLQIEVREAQPAETRQFVDKLSATVAGVLADDTLAAAEERFRSQKEAISMMTISDRTTERQYRLRLDTREHVKFLGVEMSADGVPGAVYDSAQGLSGGQAQKLSSFCLAAALRYQLTGQGLPPAQAKASTVVVDGQTYPTYGTVVLDEAFDKADAEFTRAAMEAFSKFGFHMILATPEKLLQTVQDYIGGVLMVNSPDRKHAYTSSLTFEEDADAID